MHRRRVFEIQSLVASRKSLVTSRGSQATHGDEEQIIRGNRNEEFTSHGAVVFSAGVLPAARHDQGSGAHARDETGTSRVEKEHAVEDPVEDVGTWGLEFAGDDHCGRAAGECLRSYIVQRRALAHGDAQ